jgi:hypothetical protein
MICRLLLFRFEVLIFRRDHRANGTCRMFDLVIMSCRITLLCTSQPVRDSYIGLNADHELIWLHPEGEARKGSITPSNRTQ